MPTYLKKEEKERILETWKVITSRYEKLSYQPDLATEQQIEYVLALSKRLDQREASTLIKLLQLLAYKGFKEQVKKIKEPHWCELCGRSIKHRGNCLGCNVKQKAI